MKPMKINIFNQTEENIVEVQDLLKMIFKPIKEKKRATELAPSARATGISLFAFSLFLGSSVGALLTALSIDTLGYHPTMLALGAVTATFTVVAAIAAVSWSQPSQSPADVPVNG